MKKITILSLCLVTGMSAMAQKNVVKEAERAMKADKPFTEVVTLITPAMSDPTTKESAQTYYIPGKAGFKQYDNMLAKRSLGTLDEAGFLEMSNALMGGYDYFLKAFPLDSLPDEKGKVKPKYSKDMVNVIAGHLNDFNNAAVDYWNAKDYKKAFDAWGVYMDVAQSPLYAKSLAVVPADTLLANYSFNRALAAWQSDDFASAIKEFQRAIKLGYNKKAVYDYGISVAIGGKDNDALLAFATAGNEKFGKEDPTYLNQIINYYLNTEKYAEALDYLNKGIAENPDAAQYYSLRGIIYDNQNEGGKAHADYEKALSLDPNNALALFYLGRNIALQAGGMQDAYDKDDFDQYKKKTIDPMYRQAAEYLEKAYELDENNQTEVLKILDVLYYNLNDAEKMESVKQRKAM